MNLRTAFCRLVVVLGVLFLGFSDLRAQKIYFPENQEFGAPLSEEDWKALRPDSVTQDAAQKTVQPVTQPAKTPQKNIVKKEPVRLSKPSNISELTRSPASVSSGVLESEQAKKVENKKTETRTLEYLDVLARSPAGLLDSKDGIRTVRHYSQVSLSPLFFYSKISSQNIASGSTSAALSNFNYGLDLQWKHTFAESFSTQLALRAHRLTLRTSTNIQDEALGQNIIGLQAGLAYAFTSWGALAVRGILSEEIFIRASSSAALRIDKVFIPQIEADLSLDLLTFYPYELGVSFSGLYLFPSSNEFHNVKQGFGYRSSIYLEQKSQVDSLTWMGSLFFEQKYQNTQLTQQNRRDFGIELGLRWSND
jgi:hypothetical protein